VVVVMTCTPSMTGGSDVAVTGITGDGERVPVLRNGSWAL
jgi:leucyl aminopeptidase (aminopeptidase T)